MKKLFGAIFCLLLFVSSAYAQLSEKLTIFVSGGASVPVESFLFNPPELFQYGEIFTFEEDKSNFEKYWNTGFNLNAGITYQFNPFLSVVGKFNYNHFSFNKDQLGEDITKILKPLLEDLEVPFYPSNLEIARGSTNIYTIMLNLKAGVSFGILNPYIMAGGGYMWVQQDIINISYVSDEVSFFERIAANSDNALTGNAAGGIALNISQRVRPFVHADYVTGSTKDDSTILYTIVFGLNFGLAK
jgi:opacity protein-like surface antigen